MVSILPGGSNWDVIGQHLGKGVSENLPGAVQQGYQRQLGLNSIDQLQKELAQSGGDINKMLPALARAYTLNPALERSGLGQTFLQQARARNAFPDQGQSQSLNSSPVAGNQTPQQDLQSIEGEARAPEITPRGTFATPSPFNIMTKDDMNAESIRWAQAVGNPEAYNTRFNQLTAQNDAATAQRATLEDAALKSDVKPSELPRFMVVNSHLDPRNPSQWAQEGIRNFNRVKSNDKKIQNAFIPGLGSGLLGRDREATLNRIIPALQENKEKGLEQEDRNYLADNYVTPTEIETLYHPLTPKHKKAISSLPQGIFPAETGEQLSFFAEPKKFPFGSYEEVMEKNPKKLEEMNNELTDFFLNNVDNDTSILGLREKIWEDKSYDWRQIGPAIREAQKRGLKLNPEQEREATIADTQAPMQSLPDLFTNFFERLGPFLRGNK